jgi:hypothetical protein
MEIAEFGRAVIEVFDGFPCTFMGLITFPINIILELIVDDSRIENLFDFILIDIFDGNRRRWRLNSTGNLINLVRFQKRCMKYWMYLHCCWEVEFEG